MSNNEKALVIVSGNIALMESEVISNAINFAKTGFGGMPITLPKGYDVGRSVKNFCFALPSVPNIEIATEESIYQAVHEYITGGLDIGKHQCALIVRKDKDKKGNYTGTGKLTVQSEYFGMVAQVMRERPDVKRVSEGTIIYEGEKIALWTDDEGNQHIKHEQDFSCWGENIAGAYAVVTYNNGSTHAEVMTIRELKRSWAQSQNGDKVHKAFPTEMAKKTVINRLCKKLLNKSNDLTNEEELQTDGWQHADTQTIDIDSAEEYTEPSLQPTQATESLPESKTVTAAPEESELTEPQGNPEDEDYCITIKYADYKDNYSDCMADGYDRATKTIKVYPNKKKEAKKDKDGAAE